MLWLNDTFEMLWLIPLRLKLSNGCCTLYDSSHEVHQPSAIGSIVTHFNFIRITYAYIRNWLSQFADSSWSSSIITTVTNSRVAVKGKNTRPFPSQQLGIQSWQTAEYLCHAILFGWTCRVDGCIDELFSLHFIKNYSLEHLLIEYRWK